MAKKATPAKKASPKKAAPKKAVAKKAVVKKATKEAPKKIASKAPAKKAAAKKVAAKKVAAKAVKKAAPKATPKANKKTPKKVAGKTQVKKAVAKKVAKVAPKKATPKKAVVKKVNTKKVAPKKEKKVSPPKVVAPKKVAPKKVSKGAPEKTISRRAVIVETKEKISKPPVAISEKSKAYKPQAPTDIKTIRNTENKVLGHRAIHELNVAKDSKKEVAPVKKKKKSLLDSKNGDDTFIRYSDVDLAEFKKLIEEKIVKARTELSYLQGLITRQDDSGTEDTENRYASMEDGSVTNQREQLNQMAGRQINFIGHLENALVRIENKTYGICRVTGKLIDKKRLLAVPHATLSKEAKDSRS